MSVIVALKNSNPELLVIESCKDVNLFERFVNILKDVRANEREDHLKTVCVCVCVHGCEYVCMHIHVHVSFVYKIVIMRI